MCRLCFYFIFEKKLLMKSEKEKMIAGEPYFANGKELFEDRLRAREITFEFNNLTPAKIKERSQLISKLFKNAGKGTYVEPPFRCDYGYNISVGKNFYANFNLTILDCAEVTIGDNVMFAPNVSLLTAGHPIHYEKRITAIEYAFPITIGDNVWLGANVVVNPGISIGKNSVIGSGSVVTKDIPEGVIAVGNPCKVLREITDNDKEYYFRKMKWI